ncbi:sentrin-specific protease 6-like [Anabrus simplex]|uniref:sentrin-specific protease 6-like n=1 Tax=Anabrus simplex TaxID=316456 RepID=UPI0035A36E05
MILVRYKSDVYACIYFRRFVKNVVKNENLVPAVTTSALRKEPKFPEEEDGLDTSKNRHLQCLEGGGLECLLQCRTIRIGSYTVVPRERVILSNIGVKMCVHSIEDGDKNVILTISMQDIMRVLIHFGHVMPVLFMNISAPAAAKIRNLLKMESKLGPYFDPSSPDYTQNVITLLPNRILKESKVTLKTIFGNLNILGELKHEEANNLLVRTCPKGVQNTMKKAVAVSPHKKSHEIKTIFVYPPPPEKDGITINTEDYARLEKNKFLNDVIIDFYLKHLTLTVLSEHDKARTHVFGSFFYTRLTTGPKKSAQRSHPVEGDPKLSPAEKRHWRVKRWTKNVNLFEKDFLIVPINANRHWFLAIICFPGMIGMSDNGPVVQPANKVPETDVPENPTTITPLKISTDTVTLEAVEEDNDESMDCTSEEGDNNVVMRPFDLFKKLPRDQSSNCEAKVKNVKSRGPIRQPCILIFDSLAGTCRTRAGRVISTLRDYLRIEYKVKKGKESDFSRDAIKGAWPKVPQQKNFADCGLYLLQYVESFFKAPIKDYHFPIKTLNSWFSEDVINHKREEIQKLLLDLMEKNKVDVEKLNLPKLTFSKYHPEESNDSSQSNGENESMYTERASEFPVTVNKMCSTTSHLKSKRIDRSTVKEQEKPIKRMRPDESQSNLR